MKKKRKELKATSNQLVQRVPDAQFIIVIIRQYRLNGIKFLIKKNKYITIHAFHGCIEYEFDC